MYIVLWITITLHEPPVSDSLPYLSQLDTFVTTNKFPPSFLTGALYHRMEIFSALLAICAGIEFPAQRPVTQFFLCFL